MPENSQVPLILIAEDDEDDYLLMLEALKEAGVQNEIHWVKDGEDLMKFLRSSLDAGNGSPQKPGMILLDLNMPRKDGREALKEIKSDPRLRSIPVIIMTTSKAEIDISHTYSLGVNSFIQKPVRFYDFVKTIKVLSHYWFNIVKLPS